MNIRRWFRQRKNKQWNTCMVNGCYFKTVEPDDPFCFGHTWADLTRNAEQYKRGDW